MKEVRSEIGTRGENREGIRGEGLTTRSRERRWCALSSNPPKGKERDRRAINEKREEDSLKSMGGNTIRSFYLEDATRKKRA